MAAVGPDGPAAWSQIAGGEDANQFRVGTPIADVERGTHCSGSSPTVSNRHTLWNLGVGMELAGDTKPTIANNIFAALSDLDSAPWNADTPLRFADKRVQLHGTFVRRS